VDFSAIVKEPQRAQTEEFLQKIEDATAMLCSENGQAWEPENHGETGRA
jgi:hypothetical protein